MKLVEMERKQDEKKEKEHREGSGVEGKHRHFDLELEYLRFTGLWRPISALRRRYEQVMVRNHGEFLR